MSSNLVDRSARPEPVDLGSCRCPIEPRPHELDSAIVVDLFGYGDRGDIRQAGRLNGVEAFYVETIVRGVVSWTLVGQDGAARPVNHAEVRRLDEGTVRRLVEALDGAFRDDPLPNASGAPSPDGSQESAGPTQTTPEAPQPTST